MLIMTQDRKCLFNLERAGTLFLSSCYGDYEEGKPVKVLASFPLAEDVTENLGEYESEARAMEVLKEIANEYSKIPDTSEEYPAAMNIYAPKSRLGLGKVPASVVNLYTQTFVQSASKVYKMPER